MSNAVKDFLQKDLEKLEAIVTKYPEQVPAKVVAELMGCEPETVRAMCEDKQTFGICYRKPGKVNRRTCIPTGAFIRWYTKGVFIGG